MADCWSLDSRVSSDFLWFQDLPCFRVLDVVMSLPWFSLLWFPALSVFWSLTIQSAVNPPHIIWLFCALKDVALRCALSYKLGRYWWVVCDRCCRDNSLTNLVAVGQGFLNIQWTMALMSPNSKCHTDFWHPVTVPQSPTRTTKLLEKDKNFWSLSKSKI